MKKSRTDNATNSSIKKWPEGERPREKLIQLGAEALSDAELLAILFRVGKEGSSAIDIGRLLIDTFDGLYGIDRAHAEDILLIKGLGIAKTAQLKAAIELGKRVRRLNADPIVFDSAGAIAAYCYPKFEGKRDEQFLALLLDGQNNLLVEINGHSRRGESFAFETTLSGRGYARLIPAWRVDGYTVKLFFLKLATPELAIARVRQRVREGGHDVPEPTIRRRFSAGLRNLQVIYQPLVSEWAIYENSGLGPFTSRRRRTIMSGKIIGASDKEKKRDPDFIKAEAAMQRAAQRAREKARRTGSGVVVVKDGEIVKEHSEQ
jgi:predicted ABC-type ATPase